MDYLEFKELYHHGIKGQKWGVRRYENEDGTLTEEGKRRYRTKEDNKKGLSDKEVIYRERSKEISKEGEIISKSGEAISKTANLLPHKEKTVRKDYSDISDEELRKRVNRLNLERQYGDLTGDTKTVKSGVDWTREVLQTVGALAGIAGTAVSIYVALRQLRG